MRAGCLGGRLEGAAPGVSVFSNVLRAVGLKHRPSIETGDADFDRRFAIVTDDPGWAAQLFSPGLIEAISAHDVRSWPLHGDELLMVNKEPFVVHEIDGQAAEIVRMAELILE
jgi:hypothetical protein